MDDSHGPLFAESKTLDKPDVESEPVAVTDVWETYQPFVPFEALMSNPSVGGIVSTSAERDPISEVSPQDESAQKVNSLFPSPSGILQVSPEHAKYCPLSEPSMARMSYPDKGSVPFNASSGVVLHQPLLKLQFCRELLIVAGGCVTVTS